MDRQAFKQRMQNLKSYRENNPGKGYWDWKVEAFADGGVNDNLVGSYSNHTGTPTMYVPVTKEYEAVPEGFGEIANVHTPEVTITPQSNISLVEAVDKGRRNAFEYIKEAASYTPIVGDAMGASDAVYQATQGNYSEAALAAGLMLLPNFIKKPLKRVGKLLKKNKKIISELQLDDVRNWTDSDWDSNYNQAINDGDKDKVQRIRDLHFMSKAPNNNISIRNGKPTTWFHGSPYAGHTTFNSSVFNNTIGGESALGREKGNFFTTDLNAAKNYATSPSAKSEFSEYTKPKNAKEKILDAIGLYEPKYIHPVDRIPEDLGIDVKNMHNYEVSPLQLMDMSDFSNSKVYQSNKIYPTYINPGKTYTVDFEGNPWSQSPVKFPSKYYSRETYPDVDLVPSKNYPEGHYEFDLWVNTGMYRDPMQLANHEMNHYTDYIISRNIDTSVNNNMLKQLENSLKQTDATDYYRKGTEQKAYMNQLRTMLKQNGDIQNLDEPVSSTLLKKYLDKMSDSDPIKKMFKQHKNINAYTKWFNAIPLLGTTALGANAYFNNNKNE